LDVVGVDGGDKIQMYLKEIKLERVDSHYLGQDRDKWWLLLNMVVGLGLL